MHNARFSVYTNLALDVVLDVLDEEAHFFGYGLNFDLFVVSQLRQSDGELEWHGFVSHD
jgi:hypothetical protein